jgi:hypothetical protein
MCHFLYYTLIIFQLFRICPRGSENVKQICNMCADMCDKCAIECEYILLLIFQEKESAMMIIGMRFSYILDE